MKTPKNVLKSILFIACFFVMLTPELLFAQITSPTSSCFADINGNVSINWLQNLNPNNGILYVAPNCNPRIGIGTNSPTSTLDVRGNSSFSKDVHIGAVSSKMVIGKADGASLGYGTSYLAFNAQRFGAGGANPIWIAKSDGAHNGGAVIYGDIFGSIRFSSIPFNSNSSSQQIVTDATIRDNTRLFIHRNGNVGVGMQNPETKLDVKGRFRVGVDNQNIKAISVVDSGNQDVFRVMGNGNIFATRIKVQVTPFPDYVFSRTYNLMPLPALERYIQTNKHLPNMPTAETVEREGADLGEINRVLVEKVEELTLHLIAMDKRMKKLEEENRKLKKD